MSTQHPRVAYATRLSVDSSGYAPGCHVSFNSQDLHLLSMEDASCEGCRSSSGVKHLHCSPHVRYCQPHSMDAARALEPVHCNLQHRATACCSTGGEGNNWASLTSAVSSWSQHPSQHSEPTSEKWEGFPAPLDAITGMVTALDTASMSSVSKPSPWPSLQAYSFSVPITHLAHTH